MPPKRKRGNHHPWSRGGQQKKSFCSLMHPRGTCACLLSEKRELNPKQGLNSRKPKPRRGGVGFIGLKESEKTPDDVYHPVRKEGKTQHKTPPTHKQKKKKKPTKTHTPTKKPKKKKKKKNTQKKKKKTTPPQKKKKKKPPPPTTPPPHHQPTTKKKTPPPPKKKKKKKNSRFSWGEGKASGLFSRLIKKENMKESGWQRMEGIFRPATEKGKKKVFCSPSLTERGKGKKKKGSCDLALH